MIAHFYGILRNETSSVAGGRRTRDADRSSTYEAHKKPSLGFQHFPKGRKNEERCNENGNEANPFVESFALHLQRRKKNQEWILLEKHAPIVKKVSVFLPAICIQRREICIALKFCMHFVFTLSVCMCSYRHVSIPFLWMVTMVNLCANSSERKSKEAEKP